MKYWDRALTLVEGCTPCSPGCDHCWSASAAHIRSHQKNPKIRARYEGLTVIKDGGPTFNGTVRVRPDLLDIPLRRKKPAVYCIWNDLFHEKVPDEFRVQTYEVMAKCEQHTFLILTKRASEMSRFWVTEHSKFNSAGNAWHGLTVCNQEEADAKIPAFLRVPGKKFLSIEPMLGPVEIDWCFPLFDHRPEYAYWQAFRPQDGKKAIKMRDGIDAVTLGGETGPGARPIHPDWARRVRDDCAAAGVPFLLKQMGEYELSDTVKSWTKEHGEGPHYYKVGRKRAGRLLDGREHNDMPWRTP